VDFRVRREYRFQESFVTSDLVKSGDASFQVGNDLAQMKTDEESPPYRGGGVWVPP